MDDLYTFVDSVQSFPNKIKKLEDIILKILTQTVECVMFIREYTGLGFSGKLYTFTFIFIFSYLSFQGGSSDTHSQTVTR
jgi:hypothetical protein